MCKSSTKVNQKDKDYLETLSKTQQKKIYTKIISAIIEFIKEKDPSFDLNKTRYVGDLIKEGRYKTMITKDGEKYYVLSN